MAMITIMISTKRFQNTCPCFASSNTLSGGPNGFNGFKTPFRSDMGNALEMTEMGGTLMNNYTIPGDMISRVLSQSRAIKHH